MVSCQCIIVHFLCMGMPGRHKAGVWRRSMLVTMMADVCGQLRQGAAWRVAVQHQKVGQSKAHEWPLLASPPSHSLLPTLQAWVTALSLQMGGCVQVSCVQGWGAEQAAPLLNQRGYWRSSREQRTVLPCACKARAFPPMRGMRLAMKHACQDQGGLSVLSIIPALRVWWPAQVRSPHRRLFPFCLHTHNSTHARPNLIGQGERN